jgi:hypothetical protein
MTTIRPELGLERLLAALGRDLLDAPDAEILAVADELGQKPTMKGSVALLGVTFTFRRKAQHNQPAHNAKKVSAATGSIRRSRRRPKGDAPSST